MAVRFILMMALVMVASADPDPDQDIRVDVRQEVKAGGGCGGCCCCLFDGTEYSSGSILEDACIYLLCDDGHWKYTGKYNPDCGQCQVDGDPHIWTFDDIIYKDGTAPSILLPKYRLTFHKKYVIAQYGLKIPGFFGIDGAFTNCGGSESCIKSITYYEPGVAIKLEAEKIGICNPNTAKQCQITASVNFGTEWTPWVFTKPVESIYGGSGPILLFKDTVPNSFGKYPFTENVNCITIVGTKGFSVALCSVEKHMPFLYIWAMSNLQKTPTLIHGLCNTYTGDDAKDFALGGGTNELANKCLTPKGAYNDIEEHCANTWIAPP